MRSIFEGVRIIEVAKVFSAPFAVRMFADYGAEVIKVEHHKNMDDTRHFQPLKNDWSGYYEMLNRNKKGVSLNLKDKKDLEKLYTLVKTADVFVENLTPSVKYKLKINYELLKKFNPRLIYASLSGIGQDDDRRYYDVVAQAHSGLLSLSGHPETPIKISPAIVDPFAGLMLAFGIASALFFRERTGKSQYVDVSMLSSAMNLLENNLTEYSVTKKNPVRPGNGDNAISPFGIFKAKDAYIAVAAGNEKIWGIFSAFLKKYISLDQELFQSNMLRLKNKQRLVEAVEKVFANFQVAKLERKLSDLGVPCSRINEMSDVATEEDNFRRKALIEVKHSKLGNIIVPGKSINFSEAQDLEMTEAPTIGRDNKKYGV